MMLYEVFRAAFTATVETLFGLNLTSAGSKLDDDRMRFYYVNSGANALVAALDFGQRYELCRIDKVKK